MREKEAERELHASVSKLYFNISIPGVYTDFSPLQKYKLILFI
jgi:hypothetical protein